MKNFKKLVALVSVLVMVTAFVGCGGGKSSIVGEWTGTQQGIEMTFIFDKDGTGSMGVAGVTVDTTYKTDGDKLTVTTKVADEEQDTEFTYKVDGDKLSLTADGETVEFTKK